MPMILAMNGAELGDFGAAKSQSVADLQTALVALGKGIKDGTLMKITVDGVIGAKTVAATNRALTVHLGTGQAPANLRTGNLSQQVVLSQIGTITDLIEAEIRRRGFATPVSKKIQTKTTRPKVSKAPTPPAVAAYVAPTTVTAASPVYKVPAPTPVKTSSGLDLEAVIKWSTIGVGGVVVAGVVYYFATKKKPMQSSPEKAKR